MAGLNGKIEESELVEGLSIRYMKLSGLWQIINDYREHKERNMILKVGMFISLIVLCPFITTTLSGMFFVDINLKASTLFILNPISCLQSTSKIIVFWIGIDTQTRLVNLMKKDFLTCIPENKKAFATEVMRKIALRTNFFCVAGWGANTFCVIVWNFMPVLRSRYFREELHFELDKIASDDKNKILSGWYPFNFTTTPGYEIVYCYEFVVCAWAGIIISMHECILIQLVMMLRGQINVLCYVLSTIKKSDFYVSGANDIDYFGNSKNASNINDEHLVNERMYQHLLTCIKDHQKLMKAGDELRKLYNSIITTQLGTGLLIMIISVFHFLYGSREPLFLFKFISYLGYAMVENVLYCYSGALLESSSEEVRFAMYSSEWFKSNKKFRNTAQLVMVRSNHPVSLIAVQLYPVNLTTLTSLLQLTYSASALLSRVSE